MPKIVPKANSEISILGEFITHDNGDDLLTYIIIGDIGNGNIFVNNP